MDALYPSLITAIVTGAISIGVARFSKSKGERFAEVLQKVIQAADLTAEQLVEKLQLIDALEKRLNEVEEKNSILWTYVYALIDQLHRHGIRPVRPPQKLLDSDPALAKVLGDFKEKRKYKKNK